MRQIQSEDQPHNSHTEKHFTATKTVRDVVIGMSDGLTVPFFRGVGGKKTIEFEKKTESIATVPKWSAGHAQVLP